MMCVTVSTFSSQSLQSGVLLVLSILYFTELVLTAFSAAVQTRLSVFLCSYRFLNHTISYVHCGIMFTLQIVRIMLFPSTHLVGFLSFLLAHIDNALFQVEFSCCSLEQGLPHEWGIMNEPSSNIYWFSYSYSF